MARVKVVRRPGDHPGATDEATRRDLADLFGHLFPGVADPEIDRAHDGIAIAARNPRLALQLAKLSGFIALELPWCERRDLRDLAIQTVNQHFGCDYGFRTRMAGAAAAGLNAELQNALPDWKTSPLFDEEQRLVIEYAHAVADGKVPDELFSRIVGQYGEQGTVELTTVVAFWSFWAMVLNATRPD